MEVVPSARMLSGLVSDDLKTGFVIINAGLFVFGLWCVLFAVRKDHAVAAALIWFWIIIEIINSVLGICNEIYFY